MKIDELKKQIESKTGIPADLIHGSTEEECFNYAREIAAFKGGPAPIPTANKKETRELFADYLSDIGIGETQQPESLVDRVKSAIKEIHPDYPELHDPGVIPDALKPPTTRDSFAEFFNGVFTFDPSRHIW